MTAEYRDDPLLGRVRLCSTCHEWWPFDGEFWHMVDGELNPAWPRRCIACCAEYYASRRRLSMQMEKAERGALTPPPGRCGLSLRNGRSCGRYPGHRDKHRSIEAMRADAERGRVHTSGAHVNSYGADCGRAADQNAPLLSHNAIAGETMVA